MAGKYIFYESIRDLGNKYISNLHSDSKALNEYHDLIAKKVLRHALDISSSPPPCRFSWFITGSGGRMEQGKLSDQDHGLIYEVENPENKAYFLKLGEEISEGLSIVGYPKCEGNVMGSNPHWCKSVEDWKAQLLYWMEENSWESIRNLQIFYDARTLVGEGYVDVLKVIIHNYCNNQPLVLKRLLENVMNIKSAIGPLGQLIHETKGPHQGSINLKYTAFVPYVNAVRILAIKEGLHETSTQARLKALTEKYPELEKYSRHFSKLMALRMSVLKEVQTYEDTHFFNVQSANNHVRKEIKIILKDVKSLYRFVQFTIEKGVD